MDRHLSTVYVLGAMRSITQKNINTVKRVLVLKEVVTMFDNEGLTNVVGNVLMYRFCAAERYRLQMHCVLVDWLND